MTKEKLICFGEVLWDLLPSGKVAGGAPMNVACHARQLGVRSAMISKVGMDDLGTQLLEFLESRGVATDLIQKDFSFPTGTVAVDLDAKGSPSYDIAQPVAWDYIHSTVEALAAVRNAEALVYGSLSCRTERSRKTLLELLGVAKLKACDINLRLPFYTRPLVETLLKEADVVKVNDEELDIVAGWLNVEGEERDQMQSLYQAYGLDILILTKGKRGALCLDGTEFIIQDVYPVKVKDTVGSGDAFFAGFLKQYLSGKPTAECLAFASATGAAVASKQGGTPEISEEMVLSIMNAS